MEMRDYFRIEATELIGSMLADVRALSLEAGAALEEKWRSLQRVAHTFKGAAHVVRELAMAQTAHDLEDAIGARDVALATQRVDVLSQMFDAAFRPPAATEAADIPATDEPVQAAVDPALETVRIPLQLSDQILKGLAECRQMVASLQQTPDRIGEIRGEITSALSNVRAMIPAREAQRLLSADLQMRSLRVELESRVTKMMQVIAETEEQASSTRLVSAEAVLLRVERVALRTAEQLNVPVQVRLTGVHERVDVALLTQMEEALSHLVRNAVAHGLRAHGGMLEIGIARKGALLDFFCKDDGSGIDVERLRSMAVSRGWMQQAEAAAATPRTLLNLLALPGVSTRSHVDETSGRGIGLDVARTVARSLRGEMQIVSEHGDGTTVHLRVPEKMQAQQVLVLESCGTEFAVPLVMVEQTIQPSVHHPGQSSFGREMVWGGELIPVLSPARLLGLPEPAVVGSVGIVVHTRTGRAVLGVQRVVQTMDVMQENPSPLWKAKPWIAGVYQDLSAQPRIVLDPALVDVAEFTREAQAPAVQASAQVLVIDDSLTSRMLQESILAAAGYPVHTASSAEEALLMMRSNHYRLAVVDVEMPGMDGFGFVEVTRHDPLLRQVPIIMVTSRNRPGDRERGLKAGAAEYIVKGEFDQGKLLETAARLTMREKAEKE